MTSFSKEECRPSGIHFKRWLLISIFSAYSTRMGQLERKSTTAEAVKAEWNVSSDAQATLKIIAVQCSLFTLPRLYGVLW